ncbi:BfmA/BtgA family mobilization protein [Maribacter cobaltidurans]|uniref:Uncharacterized protein n=1 Tax=Maribacter cobaltidurans TaxID=1178778 RepID=A0A223V625_9FLAO|nr:BfmA/BtgA family mobilization protein [Maribacter cobaltidurans]ASV30752.1 hypothetical protein CJ263_11280 [Maribacter cobaltidurans]GGD81483.1 hypothetical protein GCM10011412_19010 [Maribacter cobaltidurans]
MEYRVKTGVTVDFSKIYSEPFGKPCKHWEFLAEKQNWTMEKQSTNNGTKKGTGGYSNITLKKETATRFRTYSKRFNKSHSDVLDGMVTYFRENNLDPFGGGLKVVLDNIKKLETKMMKKIDRIIAIIKNMERTMIRNLGSSFPR